MLQPYVPLVLLLLLAGGFAVFSIVAYTTKAATQIVVPLHEAGLASYR